ncbi:MAG TPA: aminotransferase class I/II-fold pyridoxal phosphate-dependent enzyme [Steroidobacteraceae bacterium]|nr:aminotransferase class I/II-fold pyridoxal phosphate-dependent enzyme [Steroidobacteraceae bacterium]
MNPNLEALRPYPFERLLRLKAGTAPPAQLQHIGLSIGEPRHEPPQLASVAAWNEDAHAADNRRLYQEKFARVLPLLAPLMSVARPQGAFYLWSALNEDDERFARELLAQQHLTVLPGSYRGLDAGRGNPVARHVRISLVPGVDTCVEAAERLRTFLMRR